MKKLIIEISEYIETIPKDKLKHRVLGDYVNPIVMFICIAIFFGADAYFNTYYINFATVPLSLLVCWRIHIGIEKSQRKNKTGLFEIADARAGFSSAWKISILVLLIQILILL